MTAGRTDEEPRPISLQAVRAYRLSIVGVVLSLLAAAVTVHDRDSLAHRLTRGDLPDHEVDFLVDIAVASGVLLGIVAVAFWIWLARTIRGGASWLPAVGRALGLAIALLATGLLTRLGATLDALLAGVWSGLTIAIIVLLAICLVPRS